MIIPVEYPFNQKWKKAYLIMGSENRRMVCLFNSSTDRKTIAYARYLMSVKLGRELTPDETVDHIDNDKLNDDINNLQILTDAENKAKYHQAQAIERPMQHGTYRCYRNGCRCELCTKFYSDFQKKNRTNRKMRMILGIPNKVELKEYAKNILGRDLLHGEVIYLRDGNPGNLTPDNLLIFPSKIELNRFIKAGKDMSVTNWRVGDVCHVPMTRKTSHAEKREYSSISYGTRICEQCKQKYEAHSRAQKYCSYACAHLASHRCQHPSKDELERLVWEEPSTELAKRFGVSARTIKEWCDQYGIRKPEPGYWQKKEAGKL